MTLVSFDKMPFLFKRATWKETLKHAAMPFRAEKRAVAENDPLTADMGFCLDEQPTLRSDGLSSIVLPVERRGLFELSDKMPRDDFKNIKNIDIVAVHGLMGDPFSTWSVDGRLWLRDFLPSLLPKARIFTYGYDSAIAFSRSIAGIDHFAQDLLNRLELERQDKAERSRPILFICHSLGGIVVKKALVISHQHSASDLGVIGANTAGIAFFGVPHQGAGIARLGHFLAGILKTLTVGRTTNVGLIADLKQGSETLCNLSKEAVQRMQGLQILTFVELERTSGEIIVDESSARLHLPNERVVPVNENHLNLCRFASSTDQNFKLVGGCIAKLAKNIVGALGARNLPPVDTQHVCTLTASLRPD